MAFPVIGYKTNLRNAGAILSATSTDTGFAVTDIKDFRAFKLWKAASLTSPQDIDLDLGASGAADADYVTLVNHNLKAEGATLEVLADSTTPPTTQRLAPFTPDSDAVDFRAFTAPGALRYWRFRIAKGGGFANKIFAGELLCGMRTTLPEFADASFDPFMDQVEVSSERSEGGHYLGASLRGRLRRGELVFGGEAGIARSFLTSDFNAFIDHAQKRLPFVFVLDTDDTEFQAARWLKVPDDAQIPRLAVKGVYARMVVSIQVEEALMEAA